MPYFNVYKVEADACGNEDTYLIGTYEADSIEIMEQHFSRNGIFSYYEFSEIIVPKLNSKKKKMKKKLTRKQKSAILKV
jgi:hypothetical protein